MSFKVHFHKTYYKNIWYNDEKHKEENICHL